MGNLHQGAEYAFMRYQDMVRDAERDAMRHPGLEFLPAAREGFYRKAANWLGAQWANRGKQLHVSGMAPAHSG